MRDWRRMVPEKAGRGALAAVAAAESSAPPKKREESGTG